MRAYFKERKLDLIKIICNQCNVHSFMVIFMDQTFLYRGDGSSTSGQSILSLSLLAYFVQKECVFAFCKRLSLPLGKLRTFALF